MKKKYVICMLALFLALLTIIGGSIYRLQAAGERTITAEDVQDLQTHLLGTPSETLATDQTYDYTGDNTLDGMDLCRMRQIRQSQNTQTGSNVLVVYFSCTGNTQQIAQHIATAADGDLYAIEPAEPYTAEDLDYRDDNCRANQEQEDDTCRPALAGTPVSLESYDVIFLGYPIWWGEEPRIIDTFLESADFSGKLLIPFCTSGSSGIATSQQNIAALAPDAQLCDGMRFASNASLETVQAWIETLPLPATEEEPKLQLTINGETLTATLADNTSAQALVALLQEEDITLSLRDYAGFEKVGTLPQSLPQNNAQITTDYGDLILYQGNQFVIYYDTNNWSLTRLGHIDNISQEELMALLGDGDVTVTLSLAE